MRRTKRDPASRRDGTSDTLTGTLTLTARGFGFVQSGSGGDVLVPYDHLGVAASGDLVRVELFPETPLDKPAGRILEVLERNTDPIIGRVRRGKQGVRVYPEDQRIPRALVLPADHTRNFESALPGGDLCDGDVVRVKLVEWRDPSQHPRGELLELVGRRNDQHIDLRLIALARGLPLEFPQSVLDASATISMPSPRKVLREAGRRDLRRRVCFTIDPENAEDFDDALSIKQLDDGLFELGVHIADVSYFVPEGGEIDQEARRRATSVYLVNEVLPMLPEHISNGVCSLVPGRPRLAFSVLVVLDSTGEVHDLTITESLIQSSRRFTYAEVEDILHGEPDPLAGELHLLNLIARMLGRRRRENGSVDMDLPATSITLDEDGVPLSVRPVERLNANRLVEECMLLANTQVAQFVPTLSGRKPFIYRIHPQPRASDVESLLQLLHRLGIRYRIDGDVQPEDYRNILSLIENLEFKDLVEKLALKSLTKATYSTDNVGHFGLAFGAYTHFTSPIRRYPDLVVHRLLKQYISQGRSTLSRSRVSPADLDLICRHSSEKERVATEAEREYTRLKSLEYLERKIGHNYDGIISGIASFGAFVQLNRYLVEGLVHVSKLGSERFELNRDAHQLVGVESGKTFTLGDPVRVRVVGVNPPERKADLVLADE
jgi:ribonuclease R